MPHIFNPKKLKKLESSERYDVIKPDKVLKDMGLKTGDTILDFGIGTGFFALPALEIIGKNGFLYGTDLSADMLEYTKERTKDFSNIKLLLTDGLDIPVETSSVDLVIMAFVLHEINEKDKTLAEIKRILKPGGKFLIVEWNTENIEKGPPKNDRISIKEASEILKKEGFTPKTSKTINDRFYYTISISE